VNEPSPGARAVNSYQIEDVFLVSTNCWVHRDFNNQALMPTFAFGVASSVDQEALVQERTPLAGGEPFAVLRYYVNAEVRLLKPDATAEQVEDDESVMAELKFTFAADYRCSKNDLKDTDAIASFSRNAQFHAWPYVRETVHAMCSRLRLPRATLQMLKPNQPPPPTTLPTSGAGDQKRVK
jgi:hypothetical protein